MLDSSGATARPTSGSRKLVHPPGTLIIGLMCFALFAGLAVVSNVFRNKTTTWWSTGTFVGFALLSVAVIMDYFTAKHEVSAAGLSYGKLVVGTRKYLRWSDLRTVRDATVMKWFRLETHSGDVARISVMLTGLPDLARVLLEHVSAGVVEADTLPILQATAEGHPPSAWS